MPCTRNRGNPEKSIEIWKSQVKSRNLQRNPKIFHETQRFRNLVRLSDPSGGTTPSLGLLRVIKERVKIPIYVMLRPREGDFVYSKDDFQVMKEDLMLFKENGADEIVFGILTPNGNIDVTRSREITQLSHPLPVTFHRTFDMVKDPATSLDTLISLSEWIGF